MAKDDDRTNKPEEAGKWGTAGKSSGKNNKNGKGKEYKTDRRIDKVLQLAADRIDTIDSSASVPERLARAAKSSELLSAVWSLPPAQRLMFHHGMQVTDVEGDSTPGFDGNKEDAEKFISISSSEIADTSGSCTRMASRLDTAAAHRAARHGCLRQGRHRASRVQPRRPDGHPLPWLRQAYGRGARPRLPLACEA